MEALGLEPSIKFLCGQLQWDEYVVDLNMTYIKLTMEFLSFI